MTAPAVSQTTWQIDQTHSTVEFGVTHMPFALFRARFREVRGTLLIDEQQPEHSSVTATIQTASIDVLGERFQAVMRGEDFFDTARWPEITFRSTGVARADGDRWHVTGDLTIRRVTREVTLETRYNGQGKSPI